MAETTTNKVVREDALKAALTAVRGKVYTRTETENKIDEKVEAAAYVLPVASATQLGGVKGGGTGISIDENGMISVTGEADVNPNALPPATKTAKGAVIIGTGVSVDASGKISVDFAPTLNSAKSYTDTKIGDLIGGAPETFDTLKEIADYIEEHADVVTAINAAIGNKADKADTLAGYGITDAKIEGGVITLGTVTVDTKTFVTTTALTTTLSPYAKKTDVTSSINTALVPYAKSADVDSAIANCVKTADLSYMTTAEATAMVTEVFG